MTLKSVFEVKPHGIFCDYTIYLWFVFPSSFNGMNDCHQTHSLSSEEVHTTMATLAGIRFKIWSGLFLWKTGLWFMGSVGSPSDQLVQTHGPVFPSGRSVPSTVMEAESCSEAVFFFSFKIDSGKGCVQ